MQRATLTEISNYINADILLHNQQNTMANKGSPISAGSYKFMLSTLGKVITSRLEHFQRILESEQAVIGDNIHRVPEIQLFTAKEKGQEQDVLVLKLTHKLNDQFTFPYEKDPVDDGEKCYKYIKMLQSFRHENIIQPDKIIPVDEGLTYFLYPNGDMQLSLVDAILDGLLNNEQRKFVFFQLVSAVNEIHKVGMVHQCLHRFAVDPHLIIIGDGCKVGLLDLTSVSVEDDSSSGDVYNYAATPRRSIEFSPSTAASVSLTAGTLSGSSLSQRRHSILESPRSSISSPKSPRTTASSQRRFSLASPSKNFSRDYLFATKNERIFRDVTGGDNARRVNNVWTLGTIFAFLLRGIPIFKGSTSTEIWECYAKLFGKPSEDDWCDQQLNVKNHVTNLVTEKGWEMTEDGSANFVFGSCTDEELDLLKGMLNINQEKRLTTEQILQHPYFDDCRDLISSPSTFATFAQSLKDPKECTLVVSGSNMNNQTGMQNCFLHPTLGFLDEENSVFENIPQIKKVCCSASGTMLLSETGRVYILGGPKDSSLIEFDLDNIEDIDCNGTEQCCHYIMRRSDGKLFVYGANQFGQLGQGHNMDVNTLCEVVWDVHEEEEVFISHIAVGKSHTVVLANNDLYACGANNHKQLGIDDHREFIPTMTKVATFKGEQLKDIKCGDSHTIILTESGRVFTCGDNRQGQCGFERIKKVCVPSELPLNLFNRTPITSIAVGSNHSVFVNAQNFVYTVGSNSKGQLGTKTEQPFSFIPLKINFQPQYNDYDMHPLSRREIDHVYAKFDHTLFVGIDGRLFVSGDNGHQELVSWPYQQGFYFYHDIPLAVDIPVEILNVSCPNLDNTNLGMKIKSASFGEHHMFLSLTK